MNLRGTNKVDPNFNMSSMTDIVFLLLIFFMITSTLMSPHTLKVNLPYSDSKSIEQAKIVLTIDSLYNYSINNVEVDSKDIEKVLKTKFQELSKEGINIEKSGVSLRTDKSVDTEYIVEIFNIAAENEWKIGLSTK